MTAAETGVTGVTLWLGDATYCPYIWHLRAPCKQSSDPQFADPETFPLFYYYCTRRQFDLFNNQGINFYLTLGRRKIHRLINTITVALKDIKLFGEMLTLKPINIKLLQVILYFYVFFCFQNMILVEGQCPSVFSHVWVQDPEKQMWSKGFLLLRDKKLYLSYKLAVVAKFLRSGKVRDSTYFPVSC